MKIDLLWCAFDLNIDCNRQCEFCCNLHTNSDFQGQYTPTTLKAAYWKILKLVETYQVKNISVPILGGEPLLHPELPVNLKSTLCKLPCPTDFWMYTNGDYLTEDIIKQYKDNRIWITLSCADSSTEYILKKLALLKRFYSVPRLSVTLSKVNLERLMDLVELSIKVGFTIRFRNQYDCSAEPELPGLYERIVPEAFKLYSTNPVLTVRNLIYTYEDIFPCWEGVKSPYTCGRSFLHFSCNGHIRSCSGNSKSIQLGTVYDATDPIALLSQAVKAGESGRWSAKDIEECQGCEVYSSCQGGCPLTRKCATGSFNKPSPYCAGLKKTIPLFKELVKKLDGNACRAKQI